MTIINIHEAKTHFANLLQRALNGEDIIVAKHGKPLIRLVPINPLQLEPRQFGRHPHAPSKEAIKNALAPLTEDELGDWTAQ
jgi:prevent-host-death family protein